MKTKNNRAIYVPSYFMRALGLMAIAVNLSAFDRTAGAQRIEFQNRPHVRVESPPKFGTAGEGGPMATAERQRANQLLTFMLREGPRKAYIAEQTTRLLTGMVQESQIAVRHGGIGMERMEFLTPPGMRGEIILQVNGRIFNYKPVQNIVFEGVASHELLQNLTQQFMRKLKAGNVGLRIIGTEIIADQAATIVEVRSANGGKRFWVDDKTGVRLRSEELNARGIVTQTSYFTKIDYTYTPLPREFAPNTLPSAPHEATFPNSAPFASIQEAQLKTSYPIREPLMPDGFKLTGIWVVEQGPMRTVTILRYSDGASTVALFQQQPARKPVANTSKFLGKVRHLNGVAHWVTEDRIYSLLGDISKDSVQKIVDSLK